MRVLLDTHTLLWWLDGDRRLSRKARTAIEDPSTVVLVSAASAWEITTKARIGKLPGALEVAADVAAHVAGQAFTALDITIQHAQRAGRLPGEHQGPVRSECWRHRRNWRICRSSAMTDVFGSYSVNRIW